MHASTKAQVAALLALYLEPLGPQQFQHRVAIRAGQQQQQALTPANRLTTRHQVLQRKAPGVPHRGVPAHDLGHQFACEIQRGRDLRAELGPAPASCNGSACNSNAGSDQPSRSKGLT